MEYTKGRYSWVIRPLLIFFDLCVINTLSFYLFDFNQQDLYFFSNDVLNNKHFLFLIYSIIFWLVSTSIIKFYEVYRYTSPINILTVLIQQFLVFTFIFFAFIGAFRSIDIQIFKTILYLVASFSIIGFVKFVSYYVLKFFRQVWRGNLRQIVIIGDSESAQEMHKLATIKKELGYRVKASFSNNAFKNLKGKPEDCFDYLKVEDGIDEIYCSIDEFSESDINKLVKLAELNHFNLKFLQESKSSITKRLKTDFYNYLPVLSLQEVPINNDLNKIIKRFFDILFSIFVLVIIMSWLTPILILLIKLESKGPIFYKHTRNGINYKEFTCYKFRSLKSNREEKGTYITQNDKRVTKLGSFLRRSSLDEMPQFYNVLKGDMSVVGPRPHMLSYTEDYSKQINKYNFIFRHNVKPGITGLAQIKGYRGEIKTKEDIINRIKYDNFYIENWSLFLDIKIIFETIANMFRGQKEAY
tara:strand:- start:576 stop:1985 length:1410 start_codon:yes stop_codon:yes gene_type:complete